mmetsp:Transcript_8532/g.10539  ORF Transcript_8532/g.10539 Transcript_8532/m.10539 type:complete len:129 (-) Transcript_8532:173-559(-)
MVADAQVRKVLLCSGQIYYDLVNDREKRGINDVAIVRLEQICPFPFRQLEPSLRRFSNADVQWVQDEPKNQGAWTFMEPRIRNLQSHIGNANREAVFNGRAISPSTATGYTKQHVAEAQSILERAFSQ